MIFVKKLNVVKKIDDSRLDEYTRAGFVLVETEADTTDEAPIRFACPHCDKDYATEATLAKHIEEKHPPQ